MEAASGAMVRRTEDAGATWEEVDRVLAGNKGTPADGRGICGGPHGNVFSVGNVIRFAGWQVRKRSK